MLDGMPARVYDGWIRFFNNRVPPLYTLLDHHLAAIQAILTNVYRDRKKHPDAFESEQFRLFKDKSVAPDEPQTDDDEKGAELLNKMMFYQQMYDTGVLNDENSVVTNGD